MKEQIDINRLPQHVAIIMDGNGRWAKQHGAERTMGHQHGIQPVRDVSEAAAELGIKYLTLYAFSTENWNRPAEEVNMLMHLLVDTIEKETPTLNKNNIRLLTIGDTDRLPLAVHEKFERCIEQTSANTGLNLVLALSYSSRSEITQAMQDIARMATYGGVRVEDINEDFVSSCLQTKNIPDPDLLIRTSGELRLSNFLLWQMAYTELYFTNICWPDFDKQEFYKAIIDYQHRERRFGKTSEQVTK
ncbi:MAG: isoprenyl transferase [Paludibacteraceae bacterium]|nr:isoprenyl transferase [Paludibacteraceae bacterium]